MNFKRNVFVFGVSSLLVFSCGRLANADNSTDSSLAFGKHQDLVQMEVFDGFEVMELEAKPHEITETGFGATLELNGPVIASVVQVALKDITTCSVDQPSSTNCSTVIAVGVNNCSTRKTDGNIKACSVELTDNTQTSNCSAEAGQQWKCSALSGSTSCSTGYGTFDHPACSVRRPGPYSPTACSVEGNCSTVDYPGGAFECSVDSESGKHGFCSVIAGDLGGDRECSAYLEKAFCSTKTSDGALICSINSNSAGGGSGGVCSADSDAAHSCSVKAGGATDPPGLCSVTGGSDASCSTQDAGYCSVEASTNPSFCSVSTFGDDNFCSILDTPQGSCSANGADNRCSVMQTSSSSAQCTTKPGVTNEGKCSASGGNNNCSTIGPNGGGVQGPGADGICRGDGSQTGGGTTGGGTTGGGTTGGSTGPSGGNEPEGGLSIKYLIPPLIELANSPYFLLVSMLAFGLVIGWGAGSKDRAT